MAWAAPDESRAPTLDQQHPAPDALERGDVPNHSDPELLAVLDSRAATQAFRAHPWFGGLFSEGHGTEHNAPSKPQEQEAQPPSQPAKKRRPRKDEARVVPPFAAQIWPKDLDRFPEASPYHTLGAYDWALVRKALMANGAIPDHRPNGKTICRIHYIPYNIFLPDGSFPLFLNIFHSTTRTSRLRIRTPVQIGDTYSPLLRQDAYMELWNPDVFSSVAIVPVRNDKHGCVNLFVVTHDLWSLRPGVNPQLSSGVLEKFEASLVESNFLGTNNTIGVGFSLDQGSWEVGPIANLDWLLGANLKLQENFRVIFDREFGGYSGVSNIMRIERPFRSSWDKDAWYLDTSFRKGRERVFNGRHIHQLTYTDPTSGKDYTIDERWDALSVKLEGGYTRAYGLQYRHLLTAGAFVDWQDSSPAPMDDTLPDAIVRQFRVDRLPRRERAIGPLLKWKFYRNAYFHMTNYNSFYISESYRRGITLLAMVRYSEPGLGADVRYVEGTVGARYVVPFGDDGFASFGAMGRVRWDVDGLVDRRLEFSHRLVLPSGPLGRFVYRGWVRILRNDTDNIRFRLGSSEGLRGVRGYIAEGHNAWLLNVEWRSKPVEVLGTFWGAAAFVDLGSAWEQDQTIGTWATVGVGLRFMLPQGMAIPASVDLAWPIGHGKWAHGMPYPMISLRFGQVFEGLNTLDMETFRQ